MNDEGDLFNHLSAITDAHHRIHKKALIKKSFLAKIELEH